MVHPEHSFFSRLYSSHITCRHTIARGKKNSGIFFIIKCLKKVEKEENKNLTSSPHIQNRDTIHFRLRQLPAEAMTKAASAVTVANGECNERGE